MRRIWKLNPAVALAAVLAAGCGAGDKGDQRAANDPASSSEQVSLSGCVSVATGSAKEFALDNVRMVPLAEQPSDAPTLTSHHAIREGSWVRLATGEGTGGNDDLRQHVGQRVTIVGTVSDTGADTMGTSGVMAAPQQSEPRKDRSRAAADERPSTQVRNEAGFIGQETMANGTAPQILVQRITPSGEPCPANRLAPENRR